MAGETEDASPIIHQACFRSQPPASGTPRSDQTPLLFNPLLQRDPLVVVAEELLAELDERYPLLLLLAGWQLAGSTPQLSQGVDRAAALFGCEQGPHCVKFE